MGNNGTSRLQRDAGRLTAASGDKIRIKAGPLRGARGVIAAIGPGGALVSVANGDQTMVPLDGLTNYSLAARRAWEAMPKRAGRPAATPTKRMTSFRIDLDVLAMLNEAAARGIVDSKSAAINAWLRERLASLLNADALPTASSRQLPSTTSGRTVTGDGAVRRVGRLRTPASSLRPAGPRHR